MGRHLKLGQAFSLACLIEFGPLLPIESSGHLQERKALFRSAAWYCLSEEELDEVLEHKEVAQFLYSLVNYAKQYKYAIFKQARVYFGNSILCAARPRTAVAARLGLRDGEFIMDRKEWLGADGKPKYDFLIPPIVRADAPKSKGQVLPSLRINLQYTHSEKNYAANAKGCFVPPL